MASAPVRAPRRHASGARTTGMAGKRNRVRLPPTVADEVFARRSSVALG